MTIIGIDPGQSGGVAVLASSGGVLWVEAYDHITPHEIARELKTFVLAKARLEQVGAFPGQGVSSTWKFGQNYGWWLGVLTALEIPFERVTPLKWQTAMSCRTGGDKNVSKARAQELFPGRKITHAIADALLIAEYGRRLEMENAKTDKLH